MIVTDAPIAPTGTGTLPAVLVEHLATHLAHVPDIDDADAIVELAATDPTRHAQLVADSLHYAAAAGILAAAGIIAPLPVPPAGSDAHPRSVAHHVLAAYASIAPVGGVRYADGFAAVYTEEPRHPMHSWAHADETARLRTELRKAAHGA